jgi:hypothetical protein
LGDAEIDGDRREHECPIGKGGWEV